MVVTLDHGTLAGRANIAFVPVVTTPSTVPAVSPVLPPDTSLMALSLHVRLSNGVEFDLGEASVDEQATVIQILGKHSISTVA